MCIRDRIHTETDPEIISRFGYKSGRDIDKLQGMHVKYGETGVPIVLNDCIAFMECKVIQTIDVGTHYMFIGELLHSEILDDTKEPLTYAYYRQIRKGSAPVSYTHLDVYKRQVITWMILRGFMPKRPDGVLRMR